MKISLTKFNLLLKFLSLVFALVFMWIEIPLYFCAFLFVAMLLTAGIEFYIKESANNQIFKLRAFILFFIIDYVIVLGAIFFFFVLFLKVIPEYIFSIFFDLSNNYKGSLYIQSLAILIFSCIIPTMFTFKNPNYINDILIPKRNKRNVLDFKKPKITNTLMNMFDCTMAAFSCFITVIQNIPMRTLVFSAYAVILLLYNFNELKLIEIGDEGLRLFVEVNRYSIALLIAFDRISSSYKSEIKAKFFS